MVPKKDHRVGDPDQRDQNGQRPDQFGIFAAHGQTQRQGDGRTDDDQLPAPERECRQTVGKQAGVAGSLDAVIAGGEQRGSAKGKNDCIGVERPAADRS